MPVDVVAHEGLDEEITVIIALLHAEHAGLTALGHGMGQRLGIADAREVEDLRRLERPGAEQNLARGVRGLHFTALGFESVIPRLITESNFG